MHSTFGARLRTQREKKGVSLVDISTQSKIKLSLLEALERDDLSYWPHGLFGRAYIRSYAKAVGLEPEPLIREFLERHPDPPDIATTESTPQPGLSSALRSAARALPGLLRRSEKPEITPLVAAPAVAAPVITVGSDLSTVARLCTELQKVDDAREIAPLLATITQTLNASGLVLWLWDATSAVLKPWIAHGYPKQIVAQLPWVARDEENAIAAAFRTADTCVVDRGTGHTGAIVVPLLGGSHCYGALALELRDGGERRAFIRDAAIIIAALLARFAATSPLPAAASL